MTAEEFLRPWLQNGATEDSVEGVGMTLREMERKLIESTFARCNGNRERTAQILKIGLRTLSGKLREYGYPPRGGPGSNLKIHAPAPAPVALLAPLRPRRNANRLVSSQRCDERSGHRGYAALRIMKNAPSRGSTAKCTIVGPTTSPGDRVASL